MEQIQPKGTVLVVEDEAPFRRIYSDALTSYGYKVREVETCIQGWEAMEASCPDVVLLDLVFPQESGLDLLRKMRDHETLFRVPVVIFSVFSEMKKIQECLDAGADDYAVKGQITPPEIIGIVGTMMERKHAKQKLKIVRGKGGLPTVRPVLRRAPKKRVVKKKR